MAVRGKTLFTKTVIWLAAEIVLNLMGLDNLADYGEFIGKQNLSFEQLCLKVST